MWSCGMRRATSCWRPRSRTMRRGCGRCAAAAAPEGDVGRDRAAGRAAGRTAVARGSRRLPLHPNQLAATGRGSGRRVAVGPVRRLVSCEFGSTMIVVDVGAERVVGTVPLATGASPQDVKLSPDGRVFYVADLDYGGVWQISPATSAGSGSCSKGAGAHGLYPSRDDRFLYVSDRSEGAVSGGQLRHAARREDVADPRRQPGYASGRVLWLSGRYDASVYAIDTRTGRLLADPGRRGATGVVRVATARPLLARAHRHHALTRSSTRGPSARRRTDTVSHPGGAARRTRLRRRRRRPERPRRPRARAAGRGLGRVPAPERIRGDGCLASPAGIEDLSRSAAGTPWPSSRTRNSTAPSRPADLNPDHARAGPASVLDQRGENAFGDLVVDPDPDRHGRLVDGDRDAARLR